MKVMFFSNSHIIYLIHSLAFGISAKSWGRAEAQNRKRLSQVPYHSNPLISSAQWGGREGGTPKLKKKRFEEPVLPC